MTEGEGERLVLAEGKEAEAKESHCSYELPFEGSFGLNQLLSCTAVYVNDCTTHLKGDVILQLVDEMHHGSTECVTLVYHWA